MDTSSTGIQKFSITVPGVDQFTSAEVTSYFKTGFLSALPLSGDVDCFRYSESYLGELLGETGIAIHPNLDQGIYRPRLDTMLEQSRKGPSWPWSIAAVVSMFFGAGLSMIYRHGTGFSDLEGRLLASIAGLSGLVALASCYAAFAAGKEQSKRRSYTYLDIFTAQNAHITWEEYWKGILVEGYDRVKLKKAADRAKLFGFKLSQLRTPRLTTKMDGTPLSAIDIKNFVRHDDDEGYASIARFLWAVEVARRSVGKPLKVGIRSAPPINAKYFLNLAQALSGRKYHTISLGKRYSPPLSSLVNGVVYYSGLENGVPTQAAALSALLGRYYYDTCDEHKASLMTDSMQYLLLGKWGSAYDTHMRASKKSDNDAVDVEGRIVAAIHHLAIARLMMERIINGYGRKIIPSAYAYAFSATRAFDGFSREVSEASTHFQQLMTRSLEIMSVMADNGPFVEFR